LAKIRNLILFRGTDVKSFNPPFDAIIASECIYYEVLVEPLLKTLMDLSDSNTKIYLSFEAHNEEGTHLFLQRAQELFHMKKVSRDPLNLTISRLKWKILILFIELNESM
jgi:hypothetical protein